jgi:hypothetical protein
MRQLGPSRQRRPFAALVVDEGDVHLRIGLDLGGLVRVVVREEPQVAVELGLLQSHRPADVPAVLRHRRQHRGVGSVDELGDVVDLLGVAGHGSSHHDGF